MRLIEFFDRVEAHPMLEGIGLAHARDEVDHAAVVRHIPTGLLTKVELGAIARHEWTELEAVLTGACEPAVLYHVSRVVGYFSGLTTGTRRK